MTEPIGVHFARFAVTARKRAPLYGKISAGLAGWDGLDALYADAPAPARVPVNLFAAVHYLLLADPSAPLARFYPNLRLASAGSANDRVPILDGGSTAASGAVPTVGAVPEFIAYCNEHANEIRELTATRLPQTNEIGRSALLVAGFDRLQPGPKAHLDVGASAGLNLMLDRLAYDDGHGVLGASDLVVECSVRPEDARLASSLPSISSRLGLDASPLDLTNADDARWLEACVWPDQADRFRRLQRAITLFRAQPVEIRRGDAVDDLASNLATLESGAPVITTSWALCYLPADRQLDWIAELGRIGAERDLTWLWLESPVQVPVLPVQPHLVGSDLTILGATSWRDGERSDVTLASCHPHGYWLHWL